MLSVEGNEKKSIDIINCQYKGKNNKKMLYVNEKVLKKDLTKINMQSCTFDLEIKYTINETISINFKTKKINATSFLPLNLKIFS